MNKSANLSVRIDPKLKKEAEEILSTLGIPMSNAISIFLRQVTLHKGLPFDIKIPDSPTFVEDLSNEELLELLEEAKKDNSFSWEEFKESLKDKYKL